MTEQVEMLDLKRNGAHRQVKNQMHLISEMMDGDDDMLLREEMKTFNSLHREFINSVTALHSKFEKEDYLEDEEWCRQTEDEILAFKRSVLSWIRDHNQKKPHHIDEPKVEPTIESSREQICSLLRQQGAPEVDIDPFDGNPMDYKFFVATFKEAVETKIKEPRGRLTRLVRYLKGEAKELVRHCIHDDPDDGYDNAMMLLKVHFGDPYKVYASHKKELFNMPQLKSGDAAGFRKLYACLLRCKSSMTSSTYVSALDSPELIRSIQLKLPFNLQEKWNITALKFRRTHTGNLPGFDEFLGFIDEACTLANDPMFSKNALSDASFERTQQGESSNTTAGFRRKQFQDRKFGSHLADIKQVSHCILCGKPHDLDDCEQFLQKNVEDRRKFIFMRRLCFACYGVEHNARQCKTKRRCKTCNGLHPTGFHDLDRNKFSDSTKKSPFPPTGKGDQDAKKVNGFSTNVLVEAVSMCIIPVWVYHANNPRKRVATYALLDSCSQGSFVQRSLLHQLQVTGTPTSITVKTLNGEETESCSSIEGLVVSSYQDNSDDIIELPKMYSRMQIPVDIDEVPTQEEVQKWRHLEKICHLIPSSEEIPSVTMLIGGNCPKALEPRDVIQSVDNGPYAVKSMLGWYVAGPLIPNSEASELTCHRIVTKEIETGKIGKHQFALERTIREDSLDKMLTILYENDFNEPQLKIENPVSSVKGIPLSVNDRKFLEIMETQTNIVSGHYVLPLPLVLHDINLPNNRYQALSRVQWLKKKLLKNKQLHADYTAFMQGILSEGYAKIVNERTINGWYIPHHGVYHPKKPGKIRVVFDCSAEWKGTSLNKQLLTGPDLTNLLVGVLIRFRAEPVAMMADIEQMFYQVKVPEEHQKFLKFLWWPDGNLDEELQEYQMTVHLFGGASSPGCANFALRKAADDNEAIYGTAAAETLRKNFYVDDMLKSVQTEEKAINLITEVKGMCQSGGFNLIKFVSNSRKVLESIPREDRAKDFKELDLGFSNSIVERALGVCWCIENDKLSFRITLKDAPLTRRGILSSISSVYDPLGLAAPFLLLGKRLLQALCRERKAWDEPITDEQRNVWEEWRSSLPQLENVNIQRCFKPKDFGDVVQASLHHFSDASNDGYGQASYLRLVDDRDNISCNLVMAKSRVAPLKLVTIPRMELTAAVVSVKVSSLLKCEIDCNIFQEVFWTDSKVVISYINNEARRFHTFIANRVQLIRDHTSVEQWKYVSTNDNPADDASRGLNVQDYLKSQRWFLGPDFLHQPPSEWPESNNVMVTNKDDPELRTRSTTLAVKIAEEEELVTTLEERMSDWHQMKRIVATMLKWRMHGCKGTDVQDLQHAERCIIKMIQSKYFHEELKHLKGREAETKGSRSKHPLKKVSSLYKLDCFIDTYGLIRVGGRMKQSNDAFDSKHPVILPKQGNLSRLLIRWIHERTQHSGRNMTLNELRNSGYWLTNANSLVKFIISQCVTCRAQRGRLGEQKLADLPADRLQEAPPFTYCGLDLFGPFTIKNKRKLLKRYGVLFTCLMSRAIHLETTESLETDSFILSLRRFIARRGDVRLIRCDNGTNFVGARNELLSAVNEMDEDKIKRFMTKEGGDWMHWKFNPPYASHMGGVWERQIRTVRSVLETLLKNHGERLDDESFRTFMTEAESIVNSRPLSYETINDITGPRPLTPNHLLTMKYKIIMPPPGDFCDADLYSRRRWRIVQHLLNEFWTRWKSEYLSRLQARPKWNVERRNFRVGDVVLLKESSERGNWPMARVVGTNVSDDGNVRSVVLVTTKQQKLERPVNKIVLLVESQPREPAEGAT